MIREPLFWEQDGVLPRLLAPASAVFSAIAARRISRPGWLAPVPVVCVGNASVGGTGKTPVALDMTGRLLALGLRPHFLTRGYRGTAAGVTRVDVARNTASEIGDEALLLAALAPCWVGADRAATARAAVAAGATALVMDDGLQNPTLRKTLSFLVVDGSSGFGNGQVLPAGPLREPISACAARVQAAILIGADRTHAVAALPAGLPVLRASVVPGPEIGALRGRKTVAFAGIGRPAKFFAMLDAAGVAVVARYSFPDHHSFSPADLRRLEATARVHGAVAVCTPKDHVRIPVGLRDRFVAVGMSLSWAHPDALDALLRTALP